MAQEIASGEGVYSSLEKDEDLRDIVEMFVEEMPGRIGSIIEDLNAGAWEPLRRGAHQLKGAAGSYGFPTISPIAGRVESAIRTGEPEEAIRAAVDQLVELCSRVRCHQRN